MFNKRIVNRLLGVILAMALIIGMMPPIEVSAAVLRTPTITSPDEDDTYYDTASITFKWGSVSGATYYK